MDIYFFHLYEPLWPQLSTPTFLIPHFPGNINCLFWGIQFGHFTPWVNFTDNNFFVQLFESVFSVAQFKFQHQCFRRFGAHYQINHGEIMTFFSPNGKNFVPYKCCKAAHKLPDDTWLLSLTQIVVARLYWLSGIWTNLTLNLVMVVRFYTRANVRNCFSYLKNDARFKSDSKI